MNKNWANDIGGLCQKDRKSWPTILQATRFPSPRAKCYTHSVVGHRPKLIWYMVIVRNLYGIWYMVVNTGIMALVYGRDRWYTVDRMKGIRYLVVHFPPTRSTPGGSADIYIYIYKL